MLRLYPGVGGGVVMAFTVTGPLPVAKPRPLLLKD